MSRPVGGGMHLDFTLRQETPHKLHHGIEALLPGQGPQVLLQVSRLLCHLHKQRKMRICHFQRKLRVKM